MNENELEYLYKFYNLLYNNFEIIKKSENNSLIYALLKTRDANRFKLIKRSIISSNIMPSDVLGSLISGDYIQNIDDLDSYVITAKGIWYIEKIKNNMNEDYFLKMINDNYIITKQKKDLDDKEKVILLSMIATRAFSKTSCVDLRKDIGIQDRWKKVIDDVYQFLFSENIIKKDRNQIFGHTGNMHIVTSLFRHNVKMVQKTMNIYTYSGKLEYYLDLYSDNIFYNDKLSYLFWKIFKENLTSDSVDKIVEFCNSISKSESLFLFDIKMHVFTNPLYDLKIRDSMINSIALKNKWEKLT